MYPISIWVKLRDLGLLFMVFNNFMLPVHFLRFLSLFSFTYLYYHYYHIYSFYRISSNRFCSLGISSCFFVSSFHFIACLTGLLYPLIGSHIVAAWVIVTTWPVHFLLLYCVWYILYLCSLPDFDIPYVI